MRKGTVIVLDENSDYEGTRLQFISKSGNDDFPHRCLDLDTNQIEEWNLNDEQYEVEGIQPIKTQGGSVVETLKSYFKKHEDVLISLAVVLVVDHFIFNGAFREKVEAIVNKLLDKAEKSIGAGKK